MSAFLDQFSSVGNHVNASESTIVCMFFLPVILTYLVFKIYELTIHNKSMFFADFYGTMYTSLILSVSVSMVIFLVGENLARAFALLGVFSVIRFRNNKNSIMQLQFILVSIVIGLISGSNYFVLAIQFSVFVAFVISLSNFINRFQKLNLEDPAEGYDDVGQDELPDQSR